MRRNLAKARHAATIAWVRAVVLACAGCAQTTGEGSASSDDEAVQTQAEDAGTTEDAGSDEDAGQGEPEGQDASSDEDQTGDETPAPPVVSYLGPEGTYTQEACGVFFEGKGSYLPQEDVAASVQALLDGKADYAVIPQENAIGGPIAEYLDEVVNHGDV